MSVVSGGKTSSSQGAKAAIMGLLVTIVGTGKSHSPSSRSSRIAFKARRFLRFGKAAIISSAL